MPVRRPAVRAPIPHPPRPIRVRRAALKVAVLVAAQKPAKKMEHGQIAASIQLAPVEHVNVLIVRDTTCADWALIASRLLALLARH